MLSLRTKHAKRNHQQNRFWNSHLEALSNSSVEWEKRLVEINHLPYGISGSSFSKKKAIDIKTRHAMCVVIMEVSKSQYYAFGNDAIILQAYCGEFCTETSLNVVRIRNVDSLVDHVLNKDIDILVDYVDELKMYTPVLCKHKPLLGVVKNGASFQAFQVWWITGVIEILADCSYLNLILQLDHAQPIYSDGCVADSVVLPFVRTTTLETYAKQVTLHYADRVLQPPRSFRISHSSSKWIPHCTKVALLGELSLVDYVVDKESPAATKSLLHQWLSCPPNDHQLGIIRKMVSLWMSTDFGPPNMPFPTFNINLEKAFFDLHSTNFKIVKQFQRLLNILMSYKNSPLVNVIENLETCINQLEPLHIFLSTNLVNEPTHPVGNQYLRHRLKKNHVSDWNLNFDNLQSVLSQINEISNRSSIRLQKLFIGCENGDQAHPYCNMQTTEELLILERQLFTTIDQLENESHRLCKLLCESLFEKRHILVEAWEIVLLAETTYQHALKAASSGWQMAQRGTEFIGQIWPYHLSRNNSVMISLSLDAPVFLTGCNQSGKSTLLRAVGGCALLDSCGLCVPGQLTLPKYDNIYLRGCGQDQPALGKSSFRMEAEELAQGLEGGKMLFLIDELGRSAEHNDAVALAIATIEMLQDLGVPTIFATHLIDAYDKAPVKIKERLVCKQVLNNHSLSSGICRDSSAYETLLQASVPKTLLDKFRFYRGGVEHRKLEMLTKQKFEKKWPPLQPRPCEGHDAVNLISAELGVPFYVAADKLPSAYLCLGHVLYMRLDVNNVLNIYIGESKNIKRRIAEHRSTKQYAFYVWRMDNATVARAQEQYYNSLIATQPFNLQSRSEIANRY